MFMNNILTQNALTNALIVVLLTITNSIIADDHMPGFAYDSDGQVVVDNFGDCVRTNSIAQKDLAGQCGIENSKPEPVQINNVVEKSDDLDNEPQVIEEPSYEPFSAEVNFDFDKFNITNTAKAILSNFARKAKEISFKVINIFGHADSLGTDNYNDDLSINRANSVKNFLTEEGISENKINITGEGERNPVADNATREGRAKNRRVLIELR